MVLGLCRSAQWCAAVALGVWFAVEIVLVQQMAARCRTVGLIAQMGPVTIALPAAADTLSGPPLGRLAGLTV